MYSCVLCTAVTIVGRPETILVQTFDEGIKVTPFNLKEEMEEGLVDCI